MNIREEEEEQCEEEESSRRRRRTRRGRRQGRTRRREELLPRYCSSFPSLRVGSSSGLRVFFRGYVLGEIEGHKLILVSFMGYCWVLGLGFFSGV